MSLNRFRTAKQEEIKKLQELEKSGNFPEIFVGSRPDFFKNLYTPQLSVIAEYKRASPSRGIICESLEVEEVTKEYIENGAHALSILTEEEYFKGNLHYLERSANIRNTLNSLVPLLRKDFIFNTLQIHATAGTPASALLLIVRLTPNVLELRNLREEAEKYGIHAVVEIFNEDELQLARESGAKIIQVNARDLENFSVNTNICLDIIKKYPPLKNELWISASGIEASSQLLEAEKAGYHAVLVGSALMEKGTPGISLASLLKNLPTEFIKS